MFRSENEVEVTSKTTMSPQEDLFAGSDAYEKFMGPMEPAACT
jgi:hypothetical protein